ncbi:MAG: hypothetical protein ACREI9_09320 [Nitrospiraceae bacterium]
METEEKTDVVVGSQEYEIGKVVFVWPEEMAWGQLRYLYRAVKGYDITNLTNEKLVEMFAEKLTKILAALLLEKGQTVAAKVRKGDKGFEDLESFLDAHMKPEQAAVMVKDFFASGRLVTVLAGLSGMMPMAMATPANGSKNQSSS